MSFFRVWSDLLHLFMFLGVLFMYRVIGRAIHCNTLQHTATHCNTLQHTATHLSRHRVIREVPTSTSVMSCFSSPLFVSVFAFFLLDSGIEFLKESLSDRETKIQVLEDEIESFSSAKSVFDVESTKLRYVLGSLLPTNLINAFS